MINEEFAISHPIDSVSPVSHNNFPLRVPSSSSTVQIISIFNTIIMKSTITSSVIHSISKEKGKEKGKIIVDQIIQKVDDKIGELKRFDNESFSSHALLLFHSSPSFHHVTFSLPHSQWMFLGNGFISMKKKEDDIGSVTSNPTPISHSPLTTTAISPSSLNRDGEGDGNETMKNK